MSAYRAGQRVRIEWRDGSAMEGEAYSTSGGGLAVSPPANAPFYIDGRGVTSVTVLSEPPPDEPTGLGAVVEASAADVAQGARLLWVRARTERNEWRPSTEVYCDNSGFYRTWDHLIDPVILSEGWTP